MAANELVREGIVVMCDNLMKECQHILEKRNKNDVGGKSSHITFPQKFICRHFGIDCLVHFYGTV
jgi:hypothetical protein